MSRSSIHRLAPALLVAAAAACSEGPQASTPVVPADTTTANATEATLVVSARAKGIGPQQTYWMRVDGAMREPVSPSVTATTVLKPGRYVVDVSALPPWCRNTDGSRTIDAAAGQRVTLDFTIACAGVVVATQTGGPVVDLDGYRVAIDADTATARPIASNAIDTVPALPGNRTFALAGVASYCSGGGPQGITVVDTAVNRLTFDLTCRGSVLRLDVTTTGSDRDFDGYVATTRDPLTGTKMHEVGINATEAIGAWPEGTTVTVSLGGVAGNCKAAVGSRQVTARSGDTLGVAFDVACQPLPERGILLANWSQMYRLLPSINNTLVPLGPGAQAEWSPDGSRIAYVEHDTLRVRSGDTVRPIAVRGANPAFSPDGRRLYYTLSPYCWDSGACDLSHQVYELDLDVPGATSRVALTTGDWVSAFDLSPDGTGIALVTCPSPTETCTLSYSRLDGSGKLTLLTQAGGRPRFSPDGGTILTTRWLSTSDNSGAWLVGTDGTGARFLQNAGSAGLAWSPDGSRVLLFFAVYSDDWFTPTQSGRLFTVRASDGGDERVLLASAPIALWASWVR